MTRHDAVAVGVGCGALALSFAVLTLVLTVAFRAAALLDEIIPAPWGAFLVPTALVALIAAGWKRR